jgi:hypothetical protein
MYYLEGERRPWKPIYVTAKDESKQLREYWLNPITKLPLINPDSSILYRGVDWPHEDSDNKYTPEQALAEYQKIDKNYLDAQYNPFFDFHKNYYTASEFPKEEDGAIQTVSGNLPAKSYSTYDPYFIIR